MSARILIAFALVTLLAACASAPQPLATAPARPSGVVVAFGTLASVGTCEYRLAAEYTALALARYRAARALDEKRIDVAAAREVQALADQARAELDRACAPPEDEVRERTAAARAREIRARIDTIIGG